MVLAPPCRLSIFRLADPPWNFGVDLPRGPALDCQCGNGTSPIYFTTPPGPDWRSPLRRPPIRSHKTAPGGGPFFSGAPGGAGKAGSMGLREWPEFYPGMAIGEGDQTSADDWALVSREEYERARLLVNAGPFHIRGATSEAPICTVGMMLAETGVQCGHSTLADAEAAVEKIRRSDRWGEYDVEIVAGSCPASMLGGGS